MVTGSDFEAQPPALSDESVSKAVVAAATSGYPDLDCAAAELSGHESVIRIARAERTQQRYGDPLIPRNVN